jgi:DNA replication and repair protein RecF
VHVRQLWLTDYRSYRDAHFAPAPSGITVVSGANGEGKTNLVEAIGYLATLRSLRGSPGEALVRDGAAVAVVRADCEREGRRVLVEAELRPSGRDRVQVNGQPLRRSRDLLGALQVTVFSPDDLALAKGGPHCRRELLDDLLVALHPRHEATIAEVERVLRQRNALLKSAQGSGRPRSTGSALSRFVAPGFPESPPSDVVATLDVWDSKLAAAGEDLVRARAGLAAALEPLTGDAYRLLAAGLAHRGRASVEVVYERSWDGPLLDALRAARQDDLRRGVTTVGPHRDELQLRIGGLAARTHASQGEQRSLALGLRLAGHRLVAERAGSAPVLLLDDVFSELDRQRSEALLACLPAGQAIVTTAGDLPLGASVEARFRVEEGKLLA